MEVTIVKVLTEGKVQEFIKEIFEEEGKVGIVLSEYTIEVPEKEDEVEKSEIDILKKKYASGDYICYINYKGGEYNVYTQEGCAYYFPLKYLEFNVPYKYKLIHKKHEPILQAYLDNPKVEIETGMGMFEGGTPSKWVKLEKDFLEDYREEFWYRLKKEEIKEETTYPIFKRSGIGEVFRFDSEKEATLMFSSDINSIGITFQILCQGTMKQIPYDSERQLYDGQPVLCWDRTDKGMIIRFYDVKNLCAFSCTDKRKGFTYNSMKALSPEQLKLFPQLWGMYKKLDLDF